MPREKEHPVGVTQELGQCQLRHLQAQYRSGIAVQYLFTISIAQPHFMQEFERSGRVPARVIAAIHDVIHAVVLNREFNALFVG